jgi:tRNA-binding protein
MITWNDFEKLELRVGTIISADEFPKAKKPAYKLKIDFGDQGVLSSSAQITQLYEKSTLTGKQVIAVVNFPPRQIADFLSECLVLGIYSTDGVVLLQPERPVSNGEKIG